MDYRRIIPCLDVKDGRLVKGINFVRLKDVGDPAENAAAYCTAGADELVFLDITATVENRKTLLDAVKRTVEAMASTVPLTSPIIMATLTNRSALMTAFSPTITVPPLLDILPVTLPSTRRVP